MLALLNMESDKQQFLYFSLFYYKKGKHAVQARKILTDVYVGGVLTVRKCQNQNRNKFQSENFNVVQEGRLKPIEAW